MSRGSLSSGFQKYHFYFCVRSRNVQNCNFKTDIGYGFLAVCKRIIEISSWNLAYKAVLYMSRYNILFDFLKIGKIFDFIKTFQNVFFFVLGVKSFLNSRLSFWKLFLRLLAFFVWILLYSLIFGDFLRIVYDQKWHHIWY